MTLADRSIAGSRRRVGRRRSSRRSTSSATTRRATPSSTRCGASASTAEPGRAGRGPRPVGQRQDDAAQHPRRARPSDLGRVVIDGHEVSAMTEDELVDVRRRSVAFIFQAFGLVPILSAAENVEIPLRLVRAEARGTRCPRPRAARARRAGRPGEAPAPRAVGRGAAAGRDRPGAGEPAADPARRRADRPARLRDRPRDHAAAPRRRPDRGRHRDRRDARPGDARRGRPDRRAPRRRAVRAAAAGLIRAMPRRMTTVTAALGTAESGRWSGFDRR